MDYVGFWKNVVQVIFVVISRVAWCFSGDIFRGFNTAIGVRFMKQTGADFLAQQQQLWIDGELTTDFSHETLFRSYCQQQPLLPHEWAILLMTIVDLVNSRSGSLE